MTDERLLEAEKDLAKMKAEYPTKDFENLTRLTAACKTAILAGDSDKAIEIIGQIQEEGHLLNLPGLFTQNKADC